MKFLPSAEDEICTANGAVSDFLKIRLLIACFVVKVYKHLE